MTITSFIKQNREKIYNRLMEGNSLRKNDNFNFLKTAEELTELTELILKKTNKGAERVPNESIEKEMAGVMIQYVGLIEIYGMNENNIIKFMQEKLDQIESKNNKLRT